jgi:OmcA/MtrC family decaheme c-type cytochrome
MRKTIKLISMLLAIVGLFFTFNPTSPIGAQDQVLPRPGLKVEIASVAIPEDRKPVVTFNIADERETPLDRAGIRTEGAVSLSFIIARIKPGERQYTAYTVRRQTGAVLGTVEQAGTDSGGTYAELSPGAYTYTFGTVLPADYDRNATHTVGIYANRNLTAFDGNTYVGQDTFDFVPAGGAVTAVRDVVADASCNKCHDPLSAHGGGRQTVAICILCHTPQTPDPDTGNTTDFNVMIHKIHAGADLPSVQAGRPYQIIGFQQTVFDFSTVRFPQDIRNCDTCHSGGTQSMNYLTRLSRTACGSCHDDVNFATGQGHGPGIPQADDNACQFCHQPTSSTEFDISVAGAHVIPTKSRQLPGTVFEITNVANTKPGERLTVSFRIKDKAGSAIMPSQMTSFGAVWAGPTTDYASWVREDARMATANPDGTFSYTFTMPIPADAKGTHTIGLEGYRNATVNTGPGQTTTVRDAGDNVTQPFAVTDTAAVARRAVVDLNKCNACHNSLSLHGSNRNNNVQHCALCHNPNQTDVARRPAAQAPAESVDFKLMIHRIHMGEELENEYTAFGFGNVAHNYNEVRFPAHRQNCTMCHLPGTFVVPASTAGRLPTVTPRGYTNPTPPISTACIGCHDSTSTQAHVALNTTSFGEACATCHGEGREFAVSRVHARRPDVR